MQNVNTFYSDLANFDLAVNDVLRVGKYGLHGSDTYTKTYVGKIVFLSGDVF